MNQNADKKTQYTAIGLMSGTSLDGLDIALVDFNFAQKWNFRIRETETVAYPAGFRKKLAYNGQCTAHELLLLDHEYGQWLGKNVLQFLANKRIPKEQVSLIASHGHTWYHRPEQGYTFQLGCGPEIAAITGLPTVTDFRRADVALGGQGAPLTPMGDEHLFSQYEACINLGGFANISLRKNNQRIAFDICAVNFVLNYLSRQQGQPYDKNGEMAIRGHLHPPLLEELNALDFYRQKPPKSLGAEWVHTEVLPLLEKFDLSVPDFLHTYIEHAAHQIAEILKLEQVTNSLLTGGGAKNAYLISRIRALSGAKVQIPRATLIDFKEAVIFAFLGVLKLKGRPNVLASATGAMQNHSSGAVYYFPRSEAKNFHS